MMNRKIFITILIATAAFFSSCQKDIDIFVPDPGQPSGPDASWVSNITDSMPAALLRKSLLLEPHTDSFEVNASTATLLTSSGLMCIFPPHSCVGSTGASVSGKVYVETMLIKKKGDMIRMNKPTISNDRMLISGGELFIRIKQGSQELKLAQGVKVQMTYTDSPTVQQMKLFYGDESNPARFNWVPMDTIAGQVFATTNSYYSILTSKLHWLNVDYFANFTTGVKIADSLPSHFTNVNTASYLVFNNSRSVVSMDGDVNLKKFLSANVPPGQSATIVVISKQANDYYLGKETITTGVQATSGIQTVKINPVKKSLADIKYFLSTL